MDAVTALSGSGPAYFFPLVEALRMLPWRRVCRVDGRGLATQTAFAPDACCARGRRPATPARARDPRPKAMTRAALDSFSGDGFATWWRARGRPRCSAPRKSAASGSRHGHGLFSAAADSCWRRCCWGCSRCRRYCAIPPLSRVCRATGVPGGVPRDHAIRGWCQLGRVLPNWRGIVAGRACARSGWSPPCVVAAGRAKQICSAPVRRAALGFRHHPAAITSSVLLGHRGKWP